MTPEQLKELAEFGAEFLELRHVTDFYFFPSGSSHLFTIPDSQVEDYFFHSPEYAAMRNITFVFHNFPFPLLRMTGPRIIFKPGLAN